MMAYYFLLGAILKIPMPIEYQLGGRYMKILFKSAAISLLISASATFAETVALLRPT